jgi:hypothetical protein
MDPSRAPLPLPPFLRIKKEEEREGEEKEIINPPDQRTIQNRLRGALFKRFCKDVGVKIVERVM